MSSGPGNLGGGRGGVKNLPTVRGVWVSYGVTGQE